MGKETQQSKFDGLLFEKNEAISCLYPKELRLSKILLTSFYQHTQLTSALSGHSRVDPRGNEVQIGRRAAAGTK